MRGNDTRYNRYCALKPRKHTKPLRSAGEVAVRSPNLQREYSLRNQTARLSKSGQVCVWISSSSSSTNVNNGKFLDVVAQGIRMRAVSTSWPILLVGCSQRLTKIERNGSFGQKHATSSTVESLKRMVRVMSLTAPELLTGVAAGYQARSNSSRVASKRQSAGPVE